MHGVDTSDKKQQRNFGLTMAAAIAVLGLIRWGIHWARTGTMPDWPVYFFAVAAVFLITGMAAPGVLRPVFAGWMKFAFGLNWLVTRILLTISFFGMITPVRFLIQWFGNDPLDREWKPDAATYWEDPDDPTPDAERYRKQF